nr:MAG TPA: Tn7 transposition regulator TnsC [Caudoviricetes sp.]
MRTFKNRKKPHIPWSCPQRVCGSPTTTVVSSDFYNKLKANGLINDKGEWLGNIL